MKAAIQVVLGAASLPWAAAAPAVDFQSLADQARQRATEPYVAADRTLPDALAKLDYDGYRKVVYLPEALIWEDRNDLDYRLRLYHRGGIFPEKVPIYILDGDEASEVPYEVNRYAWGTGVEQPLPGETGPDFGYAGVLILSAMNVDRPVDELVSFLGASYFRALSPGQHYGLSARGIAVDTNLPSGEVFPRFDAFYIDQPRPGDKSIHLYATLDSPVLTGVYEFTITPPDRHRSEDKSAAANNAIDIEQDPPSQKPSSRVPAEPTVMDVRLALFPRAGQEVTKLGLAPMSSMFLFGEATPATTGDYRTEVHDSDGLLLHNSTGEWLWRPLQRTETITVSEFQLDNPRGFGLMQRDRDFKSYQDLEALYHKRPSLWVEPIGDWGPGHVELIEFPSDDEGFDNIVAMWVPDKPVVAGVPIEAAYRLSWLDGKVESEQTARAVATRYTVAPPEGLRFLVDFSGGVLGTMDAGSAVVPVVSADRGEVSDAVAVFNPYDKSWRMQVDILNHGNQPVEIRAFLKSGEHTLTETWTYQWKP